MSWSLGDDARKAARRRGFPIRAYIGANGGGKSLAAVHDALHALDHGRPVLSNVALYDPDTGQPHRLWVPLTSFSQLMEARGCDVLLDEVTGVASSREASSLPPQVANLLVQLRRRDLTLSWTTPSWSRADKIIREVTQLVTLCRGMASDHSAALAGGVDWRPKRLFRWSSYDANDFDEWSTNLGDTSRKRHARRVGRQWLWRPGSRCSEAYRTMDDVAVLGHSVSVGGTCLSCGGRRRVPPCSCADSPPAARAPRGEPHTSVRHPIRRPRSSPVPDLSLCLDPAPFGARRFALPPPVPLG